MVFNPNLMVFNPVGVSLKPILAIQSSWPRESLEAEELCREKLSAGKMGQAAQAKKKQGGWTVWKHMEPKSVKYECEHMGNG